MPRLNEQTRARAIGLLQAGVTKWRVSRIVNCSHSTIGRLWQKYQRTGSVADLPRRPRGRVTTVRQDNNIRLAHLRDRPRPATRTAAITIGTHGRPVSAQTVLNRLSDRGIKPRRAYVGPVLTPRHRQARLGWCQAHRRWAARQWNEVLFTDESRFTLNKADGRMRVFRRVGERYSDACVKQVNRFQRGVMVWGGIKQDGKVGLVVIRGNMNAQRYINDVLNPVVIPYINNHAGHVVFQHDNARPHAARVTTQYLQANNVDVMPWPAFSADLNPIEHIWDEVDRRLRRRQRQPTTLNELENAIIAEWNNIPMNVIRRYIRSMRRRCDAVVNARGGHTKY